MEMTIDDAKYCLGNGGLCSASCKFSKGRPDCEDNARKIAINTMHKYQRIKDIYERFLKDGDYYTNMAWLDVMRMVEDGDDK